MKTFYNIAEYLTGALFNAVFAVLAVVAIYMVSNYAYDYGKKLFAEDLNVPYVEYTVEIPEGDTPNRADALEVGKILNETGLTNKNPWIFFLEARLNGLYNKFRPGTYVFNTQMGTSKIMNDLQTARYAAVADTKITIPEGLKLRQIGELCESKGLFSTEEFLTACGEYSQTFDFLDLAPIRANPLEGYLFPDTYFLPENPEPKDLLDRMLNRFQEIFDFEMEARAEELGLTIDQIIIIASIIEKEIKVSEERALCSSIIYNRLKRNDKLEMDSTVLYVIDKQKSRILDEDLAVDSLYNTYKYPGLPAGPICNPGKASIIAALYPADTNYLYMVVSDEAKGEHFYTADYEEFLAAKARYKQSLGD